MAEKNKILIVNHAETERLALREMLQDDYDVTEAVDGKQAFDRKTGV